MMNKLFKYAAASQNIGLHIARWGIVIVLLWMGSLTALKYEPYGAVPFVSHSPNVDFFNHNEANKETGYKPDIISWHQAHDTDTYSYGIGALMMLIGVMIALYPVLPGISAAGSFLALILSLVTVILLITTHGTWATDSANTDYGFAYLSREAGQVVIGILMLAASMATMREAAKKHLRKQQKLSYST